MKLFGILSLPELGAAASAGVEEHAASVTQVIFPFINFLIFLYLLKRYLLPFIKDHLHSRREGILSAVKEADEGRIHAEATIRDYRGRLARLNEEVQRIRESLKAEGEREKTKLLREAEGLASKIKEDAQFLSEQEIKLVQQKIRGEMARLAQEAAQKTVQHYLTPADQKRLAEEFLLGVGKVR